MSSLFDAGERARKNADERRARDVVRQRAKEIELLLKETQLVDAAADRVAAKLHTQQASVRSVIYASYRVPGSKWTIEHACDGTDYIFQLFPLKTPKIEWNDIIVAMIATMDSIFPRSMKIVYHPPREDYQIKFFTIRVEKVVGQPGWERACKERALRDLSQINAWPT